MTSTVSAARNDAAGIRIGLHVLGIGNGSRPEVIAAVAKAADAHGFATLWCGEHVVMVDKPTSRYPYTTDGRIAVPPDADWLDPFLSLSFAAAHTKRISLATGILLLPEHNPLVVAKQAATLDVLSGGRFVLGVGVGWSAEEFEALGVPFARRGARTEEYIAAMRRLWAVEVASFEGEFVRFDSVHVNPKPVREAGIPVVFGGTSDAAMRRVAKAGDGWYGFNLSSAALPGALNALSQQCRNHERDMRELHIAVSLSDAEPVFLPELATAGVNELVIVGEPPGQAAAAADWVDELAAFWLDGRAGTAPS